MKTIEADVEIVTKSEKTEPMTELRGRPNKKAAALVKSLIGAAGSCSEAEIMAAAQAENISEGVLVAAARGPSGEGP